MINHILVIFYTIGRNAPKNRLAGTSLLLTTPVTLLMVALFILIRYYIFYGTTPFDAISFGLLVGVMAFINNRVLDRIYKKRGREISRLGDHLKKPFVYLNIFITIIAYIGSIFIFVASFKFLS